MTTISNTANLNVGIYARVSTDKQDNDNQLEQLREFAAKQGWITVVEFIDPLQAQAKRRGLSSRP
jgi:DNA invertase Pin-like site-specific DNA recombinase